MTLGKYILVIFEKSRECMANHWAGEGANPCCSIWLGVIEKYLFKSFDKFCHHLLLFYVHYL